MIKKVENLKDERVLYEYFKKIGSDIPCHFPVDFDSWRESMFNQKDGDAPYFTELETYLLYEKAVVKGFIQYGLRPEWNISAIEDKKSIAIIRNMHYDKDSKNPEPLMELAVNYANSKNAGNLQAYFFWWGMLCYGMNGTLYEPQFYIEDLLSKYSFVSHETSVCFSKDLTNCDVCDDSEITYIVNTPKDFVYGLHDIEIDFFSGSEKTGVCSLRYFSRDISCLIYFAIEEKYRGQGWGTRILNKIFYILKEKNFKRFDTFTNTDNFAAQTVYTKTGFINKGLSKGNYNKYINNKR